MSILATDKWARLLRIIGQHGGIIATVMKVWRMETAKEGKYMGKDCLGNRYFENKNYMIGRSRWVEFNPNYKWDYDASQITAEWYGWMHYKTDKLPSEDWAKYCLNCCTWCGYWLAPHEENWTGTEKAFYPYSTVKPTYNVWDGMSICSRAESPAAAQQVK